MSAAPEAVKMCEGCGIWPDGRVAPCCEDCPQHDHPEVKLTDARLGEIAYSGFDDYWTEDCNGSDSEAWVASANAVKQAVLAGFTAPMPAAQAPSAVFWYRPRSDGGYEGPLHNDQIEDVRKQSGAWRPLFATDPTSLYERRRGQGYAPGGYMCKCASCEKMFQGDKRAWVCESCADKTLHTGEGA